MESISRLRAVLLDSFGPRGSQRGGQELFDELMVHKTRLLSLFDVGPRNAQEQSEIQSGKTMVNNQPVAVNPEFARQVIFLSQHLDCSERYVAGILHSVMAENPNVPPLNCLEVAIAEFHQRRRHLVDSLRYIFEAADAASTAEAPPVYLRMDAFVRQDLVPAVLIPGGESTLACKIFEEIKSLGKVISKAEEAKQNAGSTSCSQDGHVSMGYDVLSARYDSLKYERRGLATAFCLLARLGYLSPHEIQNVVDWLAENPHHAMTYYMLTAILVAFDPVDPQTIGGKIRKTLAMDKDALSFMTKKLNPSVIWKEPGLKATILLKWALFLTEARLHDPDLEHREGFKTEELENQVWNALQGEAFTYLALAVLQLERRQGNISASYINSLVLSVSKEQPRDLPSEEIKAMLLQAFESLVRSLLTHASSELRKLKQRQEDLILANARSDRTKMSHSSTSSNNVRLSATAPDSDKTAPSSRSDVTVLYSFIGLLYSALPEERALQFWASGPPFKSNRMTYLEYVEATSGKLPAFLQWAVWSTQTRDIDLSMALYDMLAGLAKGQHCSELAYNFMARGAGEVIPGSMLPSSSTATHYNTGPTVSWSVMFGLLDSWASSQGARLGQVQPSSSNVGSSWKTAALVQSHQPPSLGYKDVLLAQSFLRFLSRVVTHSVAVRMAITGHTQFRAIPTLVSLIPLGIPLELKGTLFETLASFCQPGAGIAGVEICKTVWTLMERLEVINVRGGSDGTLTTGSSLLQAGKGVEVELEEIEAVYKTYPATIPFLQLLSTLIHTPKCLPLKDRIKDAEPLNTIPDTLGQPYRLAGIGPYVSFVVDNVFSKILNREYLCPSDRWQINDLCLCFIERVLASYNLDSWIGSTDDSHFKTDLIVPLLVHPGYDMMKRLLTNSPLQASILSYIVEGVDGFGKGFAEEEPYFRSTIVRLLRIVLRVLELQDVFIDVLVPLLADFENSPAIDAVHSRSHFTKFDQVLSFGSQCIPSIAAYVAHPAHAELVLLSIKILTLLSASNTFNNLATLIERSNDSERILNGFEQIMNSENMTDVVVAETNADQITGAGAPYVAGTPATLEQAVRLAALQLFVQNTESKRTYPNVAHFLLFGGTNGEQRIQDPHALGSRKTCIHAIIDLLNIGVPSLKDKDKTRDQNQPSHGDPLFVSVPGLAERCYQVVYQLCAHSHTSEFMMRYLRTRESFFARQLAVIPFQVPEAAEDLSVQVIYVDGSRVATTVSALTSFLRLRSWIFDLVALELHVLTTRGHYKGVMELLGILFGNYGDPLDESTNWRGDATHSFPNFGQSHMRIIEFLQFLDFDWLDSLIAKPTDLQFLGRLNLHSCIRVDAVGCDVVDRAAVMALMANTKRDLHTQGNIVTATQAEQLTTEMTYILESFAIENRRRGICHARSTSYEAWRRLLDMALTKCFTQLPHDRRENMLFHLLHALSTTISSANIEESTAVLLSETILSSITKLREDRRHQIIIQSVGGDANAGSLPAERLYALLRSILECILDTNRIDLVRGNLYASLINYLHLISSTDVVSLAVSEDNVLPVPGPREQLYLSNSRPFSAMELSNPSSSSLEAGALVEIKHSIARFVAIISRDAIDGTEVWKTIAFMLLDSLVRLCRTETHQVVLTALVRHGILLNFVRSVKESDLRLRCVLKPDPDDLNPLYVYEAKMSLFIRMAQTRQGAERLLEAQLLPVLAHCDFLEDRPEIDQSFMDRDSFLPSAIQRYHQLFLPTLQLVNAMLACLGSSHATVATQALDFLSSHRDTIVILLKSEAESIPLAFVEEFHLLVSLCASVLPLVPKSDLLSASGLGGIHAAILTLATRCLGNRGWIKNVKLPNDGEMMEVSLYASGHDARTRFDMNIRRKEWQLRKAIIVYIGAMSEFTEPEITTILSPVTAISHQNQREPRFSATIPTVGDAVEALNNIFNGVVETLKHIADLSAELASIDLAGVDNIQEIITSSDTAFFQDFDISQKRTMICRELESIKEDAKDNAKTLLGAILLSLLVGHAFEAKPDTMEMLLLILWQHLLYYVNNRAANIKTNDSSTTMRFLAVPDAMKFRSEAGKKLNPVLQQLSTLNLDYEVLGNNWRTNQAYFEVMCRRLSDIVGLHNLSELSSSDGM